MSRKAMRQKEADGPKPADSMRLDKYLKVSRIIKRRTVANDACATGHITINGKVAKAGDDVRVGDTIGVRFGERYNEYEVLAIGEHAPKQDAQLMYRQSL